MHSARSRSTLALAVAAIAIACCGAPARAQVPLPVGFDVGGGAVPVTCGAALVSQSGDTVTASKLQGGGPLPVLGIQDDDRLLAAWSEGGNVRFARLGGAIGFDLPITVAGGGSAVTLAGTQLLWRQADGDHIVPLPDAGLPGAAKLLAPPSLTRLDADGDPSGAWALYASGASLVVAGTSPDGAAVYPPRTLPRTLWHGRSGETPSAARIFADKAGGAFVVVFDGGAVRTVHLTPAGAAPVQTIAASGVLMPAAGDRIGGGTLIQTLYVVYSRADRRGHAHAYVRRMYAGGQLSTPAEVAGGRSESDVVRDAAIGRYATLVVYTQSRRKRQPVAMLVADGRRTTLATGAIASLRVTASGADALVTWTKGNGRFARVVIDGVPTATVALPPAAC